jgi:predicted GTPase
MASEFAQDPRLIQALLNPTMLVVVGAEHILKNVAKLLNPPELPVPSPDGMAQSQLIMEAQSQLGMDVVRNYNFGFCGFTGSGKSSLINAVRGLANVAPGQETKEESSAAATDIKECTTAPRKYTFSDPAIEHIKLWDMAGGGTVKHDAEAYFHEKQLYAFDCLIVVTADRFTSLDAEIARLAMQYKTPVVMAVNKGDAFVDELCGDDQWSDLSADARRAVEDKVVERKKADVRAGLLGQHSSLITVPIYIVSARQLSRRMRSLPITGPTLESVQLVQFVVDAAVARRARAE